MAKRTSIAQTLVWLADYLKTRRDLGIRHSVTDLLLLPASPFVMRVRRHPKPGFVFAAILLLSLGCALLYFEFW